MLKAHLKGYTNYLGEPLNLVAENQNINFRFTTLDGRTLNTADLYFTAEEKQEQGQKVLWLKAALNPAQYIAFRYALDESDFMLDFAIRSQGLQAIINQNIPQEFGWELQAFRNSRSIEYENRYTELVYGYEDEKVNELSIAGEDEEVIDEVEWIGYKQHFFNSILIPAQPLNQVALTSKSLVDDEALEQKFTKIQQCFCVAKSRRTQPRLPMVFWSIRIQDLGTIWIGDRRTSTLVGGFLDGSTNRSLFLV